MSYFRWAIGSPSLVLGVLLCGAVAVSALLSLVWTPFPPDQVDIASRLQGPGAQHFLGTDHFGRDVAARLLEGAWNAVLVGIISVSIGMSVGVVLGLSAAATGGWMDAVIMRGADLAFAFPAVLTAILLTTAIGPGIATSVLAIGIFNIPVFARIARSSALAIWSCEYAISALAIGKNRLRITTDHVLPNISGVLVVQATVSFAIAILAEAGLSYLGLGTQPPGASWGRMLFEARTFMGEALHMAVFPGLAIAAAVLGVNLLGDGLRDLLDPRSETIR